MLVQLNCKTCNSKLKPEDGGKTYVCEVCGSRYIFVDQEHSEVMDVNEVIAEGNEYIKKAAWYEAKYCFSLYMKECAIPSYEAFLGWILAMYECRNIKQLAKVEHSYLFESDEWKTLLEIAGSHKMELLQAATDSRNNFDAKIEMQSKRPDAETVVADEVYMMGIAEYRHFSTGDELLSLCNEGSVFQTLPQHTKFIVCSEQSTTADYFESALKETEGTVYPDKVIVFTPNTGIRDKGTFLEEMFEYHMSMNVDLTIAFVNDKAKLQRLARYGRCDPPATQFPTVGWGLDAAYAKGNRIVLLGGDYQSFNYASSDGASFDPDELYARLHVVTEEQRKQVEQAAAERQRQIDEEKERERRRESAVEQRASWIRNKQCRHCGGEFVGGFFSKKCSYCGKPKDY